MRYQQATPTERRDLDPFEFLTPTQHAVLRELLIGGSDKEIARRMNCTRHNIKNHLWDIRHELHVRNRTELAVMAWRHFEEELRAL